MNSAQLGTDAVSLITLARDERTTDAEMLIEALGQITSRDGETLSEQIARQANLIAALATFAGALADLTDGVSSTCAEILGIEPIRASVMLQSMALGWAAQLAEEEG